ncbi:hypothetical protein [Myceligenerans crystallogenes]|uniref:Tetratricopeptide repeat protein n=1 Tax=Myceligenerans crystallogenes TaxID=316335 RepID=A0ABN2NLZ6_9MICO
MTEINDLASLQQAIWDSQRLPRGTARVTAAEELTERAAALGPKEHAKALIHQIEALYYTDYSERIMTPFATALRLYDQDPGSFDHWDTHSLFWTFKWVTNGMHDLPQVPLASIEAWLARMRERYAAAGHTERAVAMCEYQLAQHVGDTGRAALAYARWITADRGEMADCDTCETREQGRWLLESEGDDAALERWQPILTGGETCGEEPHVTLADSLLPLVRTGRLDEARRNHLRGYELAKGQENLVRSVADHVEFCALTGNEGRGLEILAAHRGHLGPGDVPDTRMWFLAAAALLMDRLVALGRGELRVPGPDGTEPTAAELAAHARAEALALAARFDERNGTQAVSDRVRARLDAEPLLARLPLGLRAALPQVEPASAPPSGPAVAPSSSPDPAATPSPDAEKADEDTVGPQGDDGAQAAVIEAVDRFEKAREAGDLAAARTALTEALDLAGDRARPDWRAVTHLNLSDVLSEADDLTGAVHHALEAVSWADLADRGLAAFMRVRLGGILLRQDQHAEAGPVLEQALPDLSAERHGDGVIVQVRWWLGDCYRALDEYAEAARHWLEAARIAEHWEDQHDHAMLATLAAEALGRTPGDSGRSAAAYRRAADLWAIAGEPGQRVKALRSLAWRLRHDDAAAASAVMEEATRCCEEAGDALDPLETAETLVQHARVIADDEDTDDGRYEGLFDGALPRAADLAARAETLFRHALGAPADASGAHGTDGTDGTDGADPQDDLLRRWAGVALLAADLALATGAPDRARSLVTDVEQAYPDAGEHDWPRHYCAWIRGLADGA